MTDYYKRVIRIRGFITNIISLGYKKIQLWLSLKNRVRRVILDFNDLYYLSSSLTNLVSLGLWNNDNIYYYN